MEDINVTGLIIVLRHASLGVDDGDDAYHTIILSNIVMETSELVKVEQIWDGKASPLIFHIIFHYPALLSFSCFSLCACSVA